MRIISRFFARRQALKEWKAAMDKLAQAKRRGCTQDQHKAQKELRAAMCQRLMAGV